MEDAVEMLFFAFLFLVAFASIGGWYWGYRAGMRDKEREYDYPEEET